MPRPPDNYTHAQFEPIESEFQGETVRCMHCKTWTGSTKTLNRKKEHLLKCTAYAAWRDAGNGQDLAPANKYSKRDSSAMDDPQYYSSPYAEMNNPYGGASGSNMTPTMMRIKSVDLSKHYHEFWDDDAQQKCMRSRCQYCGAVRAKNSTRQYEHLQQCSAFLNSSEGQRALADGAIQPMPAGSNGGGNNDIFTGGAPNPNLALNRPIARPRQSTGRPGPSNMRPPPTPAPSLINHLLVKKKAEVEAATQVPFLSHAGCGTLSVTALNQWLAEQGHFSRALVTFIGGVIGKIRLPEVSNPENDSDWRLLDLLVSALNNAKRELDFCRSTMLKYHLETDHEPPKFATKALVDLFVSSASPSAAMLEALTVLWSVEYLYCESWRYASTFISQAPPSSTSYSLPSYLSQPGNYPMPPSYGQTSANGDTDSGNIAALRDAFIPNWTSSGFNKFVDACKAIVDELANAQTSGNGAVMLSNCELVFSQVVHLWKQIWPEVTGMGEEENGGAQSQTNGGTSGAPIEVEEDEEDLGAGDEDASGLESPYGGTGLGAVDAANRA